VPISPLFENLSAWLFVSDIVDAAEPTELNEILGELGETIMSSALPLCEAMLTAARAPELLERTCRFSLVTRRDDARRPLIWKVLDMFTFPLVPTERCACEPMLGFIKCSAVSD
jgi:hypothetical protein